MDGRVMGIGRTENVWELYEKQRAEREKEKTEAEESGKKKDSVSVPRRDAYIPGDSAPEGAGLPEEIAPETEEPDGEPSDGGAPKKAAPPKAGDDEEKCTANTDKVEREIRKLKKRQQELERQIRQAQDDPEKREKLEKELQQVEQELKLKDTDSYRKQHAEVRRGE